MSQVEILYADSNLVVANKPAGMPTQPDKSGDRSLLAVLRSGALGVHGPGAELLHRIDRRASGAVLLALRKQPRAALSRQLRSGLLTRVYWVVPEHPPDPPEGVLRHRLATDRRKNKAYVRKSGDTGARAAELRYRTLHAADRYVLVEATLSTGRHHQIRAQFAAIGTPIKGDLKYGARRSNRFPGIHLHCRSLAFTEPETGSSITATADPPDEPLWNYFSDSLPTSTGDA